MEIGLKERLIGAVVLVILGIIIIPFFLRGPAPDSTVTQPVNLPPAAAGTAAPPQEYTLPLNGAPAGASHTAPAVATAPALAAAKPGAQAVAPPPPAAPAPAKPVAQASAAGQWVVQAGSYGSQARADEVMRKLQGHGLHTFVSRFQKGGRTFYRVRVGPYADRAQAEHAAGNVAHAYGGKADVLPNS